MDEAAELGWPSLTSMPLSCWSPLSNLAQSTTDTDTAVTDGGMLADTVAGADTGFFPMVSELLTVTEVDTTAGAALETTLLLPDMGPTVAAKLMGLAQALMVGGGAGARDTRVAGGLAMDTADNGVSLTSPGLGPDMTDTVGPPAIITPSSPEDRTTILSVTLWTQALYVIHLSRNKAISSSR